MDGWSRPLLSVRLRLPSRSPLCSREHSGRGWELQWLPITHPVYTSLTFSQLSPSHQQVDFQSSHIYTPLLSPILLTSLPCFLSPSLLLIRGHFTSKPLHYLPSLRAIRNGVTLSGRHGHGIKATHPLSWGPLWGPPTLMERILGPLYPQPNSPYSSIYPQPAPPFDW